MNILIRGMDKPTDCGLCPFEDFGYCAVKGERNTSESGIDADCPLIEVADRPISEEQWKQLFDKACDEMVTMCEKCDAVSVVRCKECKYWRNTDEEKIPTANIMCGHMHSDDFCSYGVRKESE